MKESTRSHLKENMKAGKYYTHKEVLKIINSTQSSIAEYIFQDIIACGYLQEGINNSFRINQ